MVEDRPSQRTRQMNNTVVGLMSVPPTDLENRRNLLRLAQLPASGIIVAIATIGIEIVCLSVAFLTPQHRIPAQGLTIALALLPFITTLLGPLLFFPRQYLIQSASALARVAAQGDSLLAPYAALQPVPLTQTEFTGMEQTIGPVPRARAGDRARAIDTASAALQIGGIMCVIIGAPLAIASILGFQSLPLAGSVAILTTGGTFAGVGIWTYLWGRRNGRRAHSLNAPFLVTVRADGMSWETQDSTTSRTENLAWRDVDSFCVLEYAAAPNNDCHRVFMLSNDTSRLLWEWSASSSVEESEAGDLLVRLAYTKTGLPLRNLMPGVSALAAVLRAANFLNRTRAEKAMADAQPQIPGVPRTAMLNWTRAFVALTSVAIVLGLALEALVILGHVTR